MIDHDSGALQAVVSVAQCMHMLLIWLRSVAASAQTSAAFA